MDVTDTKSVRAAAAQVGDGRKRRQNRAPEYGAIAECAGGTDDRQTKYRHDQDEAAAPARTLDVNTMDPLRVIEAFLDKVARSERKLVVTITSGMGSLTAF